MTCLENLEMSNEVNEGVVGDELQKISVMKSLPNLIKGDLTACIQRIIPRMHQTLPHGTSEYNVGACDAVRVVCQQNLMSTDNFTKVFLQHILNSLESRDSVAADEWLNVLLDVIPVLPVTVLQNEVLPVTVHKSHISKPVSVRITSCRILGRLALSFSPFQVKKDVIPVVSSLCQDVSGEVRAAISAELPSLSVTLGLETSNYILNHVLDLVSDEETMVREAAIEAVAQMLPRFPPDVLKSTIIPLTKKVFVEVMKNEDNLLLVLSKFYGQYAIGLKNAMTVVEKSQFLQRYIQLSQLNVNTRRKLNPYKPIVMDESDLPLLLTHCRLNCAFNYPAMVLFAADLKPDLVDSLYSVLRNLASDNYFQVRRKIAAGFFEVMKIMPKWHTFLKIEFVKLLKDEVDDVLEGLVPNISNILIGFSETNTLTADKMDSGKDVGQAIFICEKNLSEALHWRLHEELLLALRAVPKVFHPEFVYLYFVPLLASRAISGRILPCRIAALHTLLVIAVDPSQVKQKLKIRNKILELCNNSSFHCRSLFLRGMSILMTLSPELLKELFFQNITSMADDKVPNIKLMVCKLLPRLKALALEPIDRKLLASIDASVEVLSVETDRDVEAQLKSSMNQMDELDKSKGIKRASPEQESEPRFTNQIGKNLKFPSNVSPLTDMSFSSDPKLVRASTSQYSVALRQRSPGAKLRYAGASSRIQSIGSTQLNDKDRLRQSSRLYTQRTGGVTRTVHKVADSDRRKLHPMTKLAPDEFLVDAGIPFKSTTVMKRIPTPRPVHRSMMAVDLEESELQNKPEIKENLRRSLPASLTVVRPSLTLINKNLNVTNRPSSLPVKKTNFKPLTNEEIEKELMQSDSIRTYSLRMSDRQKYSGKLNKTAKKENKRHSLDVAEITNSYNRMETRSSNINKRYSLDVESKKDLGSKKSLACINNNTLLSPKLGSTRSGIVRPQSCVLQVEKVNHSKRSMSVENLPPKVTRLASRLPVRSTDPKPSKPK